MEVPGKNPNKSPAQNRADYLHEHNRQVERVRKEGEELHKKIFGPLTWGSGGGSSKGTVIFLGIAGALGIYAYLTDTDPGPIGFDGFAYSITHDSPLYDMDKKKIGTLEAGSCVIGLGVGLNDFKDHRYLEVRTPDRFNGLVDGRVTVYQENWGTANCSASLSAEGFSVYKVFHDSVIYHSPSSGVAKDVYLSSGSCVMVDETSAAETGRLRVLLNSIPKESAPTYVQPLYIDRENTRPMGLFDLDCLGQYFSDQVQGTDMTEGKSPPVKSGSANVPATSRFAQVWTASPAL